jgi:hypothetical protein
MGLFTLNGEAQCSQPGRALVSARRPRPCMSAGRRQSQLLIERQSHLLLPSHISCAIIPITSP